MKEYNEQNKNCQESCQESCQKIKDIKEIILQSWEYLKYIVFVVEVDKDW